MDTILQKTLEKANRVAQRRSWQELAEGTLELLLDICQASAAALFWPSPHRNICWKNKPDWADGIAWLTVGKNLQESPVLQQDQPVLIENRQLLPETTPVQTWLVVPLPRCEAPAGAVVLFDAQSTHLELLRLVAGRMATEFERAAHSEICCQREERLTELNDILGQLGASLDPEQVLRTLIERARQFLRVEVTSLFLVDDETGDLVLQVSSQADEEMQVEKLRVPFGKGIIGYVAQTGESVVVDNADQDTRHYQGVDQITGFDTRSILAVPLVARSINLGHDRGIASERIIGGMEALNKLDGDFQPEDIELLQQLARGAATILVVAQLYVDANNLFFDVIQAIVAAIDAKDPYTVGHSQRVSNFSVEIARELGLSPDQIYHIRLGSLFHDLGKIGVPDGILSKPGRLDDAERRIIEEHPGTGARILGKVRLLQDEIPALSAHHERQDGTGYPDKLTGAEIPLIGRIVAVADVFDALTSDRPYRAATPAEEAITYLVKNVGTHFDCACVEALIRAYRKGRVQPQNY